VGLGRFERTRPGAEFDEKVVCVPDRLSDFVSKWVILGRFAKLGQYTGDIRTTFKGSLDILYKVNDLGKDERE